MAPLILAQPKRDEKGDSFATIMISRDHGVAWTVPNRAYNDGSECQVAELSDGSLMLNIRTRNERFRAVRVTRDLGRTWAKHATDLKHPDRAPLQRKSEAVPESQSTELSHHTIQLSLDDGATWPETCHVLLDEGRGRGYPSVSHIGGDHVGIVYEGSRADLVFEKFAISELLPDPGAAGR
ncbi:MAG: exo-alpha-sialidase [Acidobacteria bacterium]|nr:exo-alpha-sialidase [Acidobacteriota bacterium]